MLCKYHLLFFHSKHLPLKNTFFHIAYEHDSYFYMKYEYIYSDYLLNKYFSIIINILIQLLSL